MVRGGSRPYWVHREDLARRYLCGDGIELGALTKPLRVPPDVRVRYVDRLPVERLIQAEGPGLRCAGIDPQAMVHVDVVDDASTLATFPDRSVDFVIANHVLEHLEDPVCALENMLRVLRRGGVLLLTLPDPRYTFDRRRSRTTVEHVIKDHTAGPATSRYTHYEEWAREIEGREDAAVPGRVTAVTSQDARHHFHVWQLEEFLALLLSLELPCELVHAQAYLEEFAVVLKLRDEYPQPDSNRRSPA